MNDHIHLWTRSLDGAQFGNAVYDDVFDAAAAFFEMVRDVTKDTLEDDCITFETVLESLTSGRGMYAGVPAFIVVVSKCDDFQCASPTWN